MVVRFRLLLALMVVLATGLTGCSTTRRIGIDAPTSQPFVLEPLPGFAGIDGDDYYVQLISDFDFKATSTSQPDCENIAPSYEKGGYSATLLFGIRNDTLSFERDASGFVYQSQSGQCNLSFEAQKLYLTPWIRLDSSKDTVVNYHFLTNENSDINLSKLAADLNTASGLLALTGVGAGVAVLGKLASYWMLPGQERSSPNQQDPILQAVIDRAMEHNRPQNDPANPGRQSPQEDPYRDPPKTSANASPAQAESDSDAKRRSESHTLSDPVAYSGKSGTLNEARIGVYEMSQSSFSLSDPELRSLGSLRIYPQILPSLLLKIAPNGLPDASDLSLDELWRSKIKAGRNDVNLKQIIETAQNEQKPSLEPDWSQYQESEANCRKLKVLLKDLGFNKFDRNAILYYFLNGSADWNNYNVTGQEGPPDEFRISKVKKIRAKNFGNCLSQEDYRTMKRMGLPVKTAEEWDAIAESGQKKIKFLEPLQSIERQLVPVIRNSNPEETQRQVFPLIATQSGGNGTLLLQNHLSDFGLEQILEVPTIPGEGIVINAMQLAKVLGGLKIVELSCARPVMEQGRPLGNLGILLFSTEAESPIAMGGALEFEFNGGIISRLAIQHPSFRDFKQSLDQYPEIGGCSIETALIDKLYSNPNTSP